MIELKKNQLVFRFPEIHENAVCTVEFQRTLRIPDDNQEYALPPGLGRFPVEHVEDHAQRLPANWKHHGGVLLPMYQAEALWLNFSCPTDYPFALKIAAGKINAVTGEPWTNKLTDEPQDYVVAPTQPWLDGFSIKNDLIRQFVAMPLGKGYTAEEQLTVSAEHGGIQIIAFPMSADAYEKMQKRERDIIVEYMKVASHCMPEKSCEMEMGLAPGGLMRQEIYDDEYGFDVWEKKLSSRAYVHILNSEQWQSATDKAIPGKPPSAKEYTQAGLPWFEYYSDKKPLPGSKTLAGLDSVAGKGIKMGEKPLLENQPVKPKTIGIINHKSETTGVSDGQW